MSENSRNTPSHDDATRGGYASGNKPVRDIRKPPKSQTTEDPSGAPDAS